MSTLTYSMTHAAAGLQGLAAGVRSSYGMGLVSGLPCATSWIALPGNRFGDANGGGMKVRSTQ